MRVTIETTSNLERRLTVGVPAAQVDGEVDSRLQRESKNVRLPGFRPGKIPMKVMRQRFGAGVRQQVLGEVVSRSFKEAVLQEKLRPAGEPVFEPKNLEQGKDLQFVATFEIFPEVELADMTGISVERLSAEVKEEDVDRIIQSFCREQGTWEETSCAAELENKVNISYVGRRDGEPIEGGTAEGRDLVIGSGSMIPGFEDGIIGMKAGEQKLLQLQFPENYHNDELRGQAVEFTVTLNRVSHLLPAAVNEELFAKYGVSGGEDEFRREVAANMKRELKNTLAGKVKQQVMEAVVNAHKSLELPKTLVRQEISTMRNQMFRQFGGAGNPNMNIESLLPDEMFAQNAERRVKLGLILTEYVTRHGLKADVDRVREVIEEMAATYESPQEVIDYYYSNEQQLAAVESKVLEDQVVEKLLGGANLTERVCTYQEAVSR